MKSRLLTLICILLFSFGFAQDTDYGVRAALNISNLDFDPDATFDNQHRNGFAFAAFADFGISDSFSALVELQYSAEGAKADDLRADYIQMPIMARIGIGAKLKVGVGPMLSLKTWKEQDAFSTFTFSGVGGLEYMISDELFVDVRVHYGLSNILDEDLNGNLEAQNTTFQFGIGLKL